MALITVGFKGGSTLTFTCEEFSVQRQNNAITRISWNDTKEVGILHLELSEIQYIVQHMPKETDDGTLLYEWPGPNATKPSIGFK